MSGLPVKHCVFTFKSTADVQNPMTERRDPGSVGGNYRSGAKWRRLGGWGVGADSIARNLNKSIFFSLEAAIFQSDGYCKHHSSTQHYETR